MRLKFSAKDVEEGGSWTALVDLEIAELFLVANTIRFNISEALFSYSNIVGAWFCCCNFPSMNLLLTPLLGDRAAPAFPWNRVRGRDGEFRRLKLPQLLRRYWRCWSRWH